VAASSQVTALGTAAGGVLLWGDSLGWVAAVCAAAAAALGIVAVVSGTRWRLERDLRLADALELRPHEPVVVDDLAQRDSRQ
jgi:hypothetical protein